MGIYKMRWAIGILSATLLLAGCGPTAAPSRNVKHAGKTAVKTVKRGAKTVKHGTAAVTRHNGAWIGATSKVKPISLSSLPPMTYIKKLDPWTKGAHQVSRFIVGMGYHWATTYPGLVLMTNKAGLVTGVETTFPQKLGSFPWYDPPTTVPNAGVAYYSEHLYFINPASITPTMTTSVSDLTSWTLFKSVNTRLSSYVADGHFHGFTMYGPPHGPGIKVLTNSREAIAGFVVSEPASWGHQPHYYPGKGHPITSKVYGKAYFSVLLLQPLSGKAGKAP